MTPRALFYAAAATMIATAAAADPAQEAPPAAPAQPSTQVAASTEAAAATEAPPSPVETLGKRVLGTLHFGVDAYGGTSTRPGNRRTSDGYWAGNGPILPSVAYVRWEDGKGRAMKLSMGLGSAFNGRENAYDQPAEAWIQFPAGELSVTAGKYWVPFALQEWEYETKPGVMGQWSHGRSSLVGSLNENPHTGTVNGYFHASRDLGGGNSVGLSMAGGRGLSFDSSHDRGFGLDGSFGYRGFRLTGEHLQLYSPGRGEFRFTWVKLAYERAGRFKPYLGWYDWDDQAGELGRFRSLVVGTSYQINKELALDTAWSAVSDRSRGVAWFQFHYTWEN